MGTIPAAPKFSSNEKWIQWEQMFMNNMTQRKGVNGNPLVYVIRRPLPVGRTALTDVEKLIWSAPHSGPAFEADTKQVYMFLKACVLDTVAWPWMQSKDSTHDGKKCMAVLREHYDGPGMVQMRMTTARAAITSAHYKNERAMAFDTYLAILNSAFQTLEEAGESHSEKEKVQILLNGIRSDTVAIQSAVTFVRGDKEKYENLLNASNYLSETIRSIYQTSPQLLLSNQRNVSAFGRFGSVQGRGGRGRWNGRGRNFGRGGSGRFGRGGRSGGRSGSGSGFDRGPHHMWYTRYNLT